MKAANRAANKRGGPDLSKCFVPVAAMQEVLETRMPDTFREAAPNLMLTVQSRAVAEARSQLHNMNNPADSGFIGRPYAEHLTVSIVLDRPNTKHYLPAADVEKWGVSVAKIFEAAYGNLGKLPLDFRSTFKEGRVFRSFADDTYDAARLLLPSFVFEQLPVRGSHVAMVPHPNVLLITGDQDPEGLRIVLREAQEHLRDRLSIGPFMFRISRTGLEPWTPDLSPADRKEFEGLVVDTLNRDYALQQRLLRVQQHTLPEDDQRFIASYGHLPKGRPDGLKTVCAWAKDVPSLLPKTDAIVFGDGRKFQGIVPWSLVAAQMSDELEPAGTYPERYSALSFPTDEQLHDLIQEAVRRGVSQEP